MKKLQYVIALLAIISMGFSITSCDKEVNPDVDAKQNYWIDFQLSNAGSLSQEAQKKFIVYRDSVIYNAYNVNVIEHGMYCTEEYAMKNFNAVAAIPASENDVVQKIMVPTAKFGNTNNFDVTMTLSKDSMNTVIATKTWRGTECISQ